jgi:hypothetical protein
MICQVKRDPNTDQILEVLDPFRRTSKVFDDYYNFWREQINNDDIAKEVALKSYLFYNNSEQVISKSQIQENVVNDFINIDNKNLLLGIGYKTIPTDIAGNYKASLDYLKKSFINLGFDIETVDQLSRLYISSFVDGTTDPNLYYYLAATAIKDEQVKSFIFNNINVDETLEPFKYSDTFTDTLNILSENYNEKEYFDPNIGFQLDKKETSQKEKEFRKQARTASEESIARIDKAKENIRSILGDNIEVSTDMEGVMENMKVNGLPFGMFMDNIIYLNDKKMELGTEYHEAFHAVFRMFLTDSEIDFYLNEARKEMNLSEEQLNNKIKELKESVNVYESLSNRELEDLVYEEYLADKYQQFTKTNKPSTSNSYINNLFNRLLNMFLELIGVRSKVDALFYNINNQRYKNKTITPNKFVRQMKQVPVFQLLILDSSQKEGDITQVLTAKENQTNKIINDVASLIYKEIRENPNTLQAMSIDTLFEKVMEDRKNFYSINSNKEYVKNIQDPEERKNKITELTRLSSVFSMESKNQHNIDIIRDGVKERFKLLHNNPFDKKRNVLKTSDNVEMLDISNVEMGGYDMMGSELREFMNLITFETIDEYTGKPVVSSVDGSMVYDGLIKFLSSKEISDNFMELFEIFVTYGNPMSKAVFNVLKEKTGYGTENFDRDHQLISLFINSFNKEKLSYLQFLRDPSSNNSRLINANREDVDAIQIDEWSTNWDNEKLNEKLSNKDSREEIENVLEILQKKLFVDIIRDIDKDPNNYKEKIEKLIVDLFEGFSIIQKTQRGTKVTEEQINIPSLEKLTGIVLSPSFISYSIFDHIYNRNRDLFEKVFKEDDIQFYNSFKNKLVSEANVNRISLLDESLFNQIKGFMTKPQDQVDNEIAADQRKALELFNEQKNADKFIIDPNNYRNIYLDRGTIKEKDGKIVTLGVIGWLKRLASANAIFDETIAESNFQDANQNQRYSFVNKFYQIVATRRLRNKQEREKLLEENKELLENNHLLNPNNEAVQQAIFDDEFKFNHTGDQRQTRITDDMSERDYTEESEVQEGKGVTSKTIDFKSYYILLLDLFNQRKDKTLVTEDGEVTVSFAYYVPKIFETKSTDEAILLPVNNINNNNKPFYTEDGITDEALDVMFNMFETELNLIKKAENDIKEGLPVLREFFKNELSSEQRLEYQKQLAVLRNKEYDESEISQQQKEEDTNRINELESLINKEYTGPMIYEKFHISRDKNGNIKGLGTGFELSNFKNLMDISPLIKEYINARKKVIELTVLLDRPLTNEEQVQLDNARNIIKDFDSPVLRNAEKVKNQVKQGIKKMINDDLQAFHQRLISNNIAFKDTDGKLQSKLLPNYNKDIYSSGDHFVGDYFVNHFINAFAYNSLIDKDPRYRTSSVDAVKRNAGSLAFGTDLGRGEFNVAYRQEEEREFEVVTGEKEVINRDDGQAHMSVDRYIFILQRLGRTPESIKPILQKIRFGDKLTWDEKEQLDSLQASFNSVKGVYFDGVFYQKLSYAILVRNLTSWLPKENEQRAKELREQIEMLEGSAEFKNEDSTVRQKVKYLWDEYETLWQAEAGKEVLHNMRMNMQFNGIDEVLPLSASKLISPAVSSNIDGNYDFSYNKSKRKNEFWRLQVETPSGKTKIVLPSQLIQLIDNEQKLQALAASRGKVYKMSEVVKKYRSILTARVRNSLEFATSMLGSYDESGKFERDIIKFQEKILSTLKESNSDEIILDFFRDLSYDKKSSRFNFNIPAIREKFEQIFLSHFSKNVLQQVVPGDKLTLISDFGVELVIDEKTGKIINKLELSENRNEYYEKDPVTGNYSLKQGYTTRRLQFSAPNELQGININGNLYTAESLKMTDDDFNKFLENLEASEDFDTFNEEVLNALSKIAGLQDPKALNDYNSILRTVKEKDGKPIIPEAPVKFETVISGLQTGVDTIALQRARAKNIKTGGTTTADLKGEKQRDHTKLAKELNVSAISLELQKKYEKRFPKEAKGQHYYNARTEQNVINSDVTIYFTEKESSAGLTATRRFAKMHGKPFFVFGKDFNNAEELKRLLSKIPHATLNVAGNREDHLSDEFSDKIKNVLDQLFTEEAEINEEEQGITVNLDKLKDLVKPVYQAGYSEVIMPMWARELYNLKAGDLIDENNKEAFDSIFKMFATRIPVEDKRSMIVFKVVDFLPVEMGSVAVLPLETILFSGEDFDIDAKYTLRKDFYTAKIGFTTKFNVFGEYNIDDLRPIYDPNNTGKTDKEIIDEHLWNEYLIHTNKNNIDVLNDIEKARDYFINVINNGKDVFKEVLDKLDETKEKLKELRDKINPLNKKIRDNKKLGEENYNDYRELKDEYSEVSKSLLNSLQNEINNLVDDDYKVLVSEANNILKRFQNDEIKLLSELTSAEFNIMTSEEYKQYSNQQDELSKQFDEEINKLTDATGFSVDDFTNKALENYVEEYYYFDKNKGYEILSNISKIKSKAAKLKEGSTLVEDLENIRKSINNVLEKHIDIAYDKKNNPIKLTNSLKHQALRKEIYRNAKTTIKSFIETTSIRENQALRLNLLSEKKRKFSEMQSFYEEMKAAIEERKPLQEERNELNNEVQGYKKELSRLKYEVLKQAMKMNKLPSTLEEFIKHPNYKTFNNTSLSNELVEMLTLMYTNQGMDEIRYRKSSLEVFHGDKNDKSNPGLSKMMLSLTGRSLKDYLYNTPEGLARAKEANKLGAQLIGPAAIANIVKSALGRSGIKLRKNSIMFDGNDYTNVDEYTSKDIEFSVTYDKDNNMKIDISKINNKDVKLFSKDVVSELSYLLAAMTDNAKHNDAYKLNLTLDTLGVYTYMISLGMGLNRTLLFANQPVMFDYNNRVMAKNSEIMSTEDIKNAKEADEIKDIRSKYEDLYEAIEKQIKSKLKPQFEETEYMGKKYNTFDEFKQDKLNSIDNKNFNLDSTEMLESTKLFEELGITPYDTVNEIIEKVSNSNNSLNKFKQLYGAVINQINVINSFNHVKKQSKQFISINALLSLNQGFDPSFDNFQDVWDLIDTFKIDVDLFLNNAYDYTNIPEGSNVIYDIAKVLDNNEDVKEMLRNFLKIDKISKEFVITQTDYFDRIYNKISQNIRFNIKDKKTTLSSIKQNFLSYISLLGYKNSFTKNGKKVPFGPELLYSDLVDPMNPDDVDSMTIVEQLDNLLSDPKYKYLENNIFIKNIKKNYKNVAKNDINKFNANNKNALAIRVDTLTANTRKKMLPINRIRIANGFREIMSSVDPKIRKFAESLFNYLIIKDGLQFKNKSFIKYVPAEMYQDYSDILEKINTGLRNDTWESTEETEGLQSILGFTKKELEDNFISLFARDPNNKDLFLKVDSTILNKISVAEETADVFTIGSSIEGEYLEDIIDIDLTKIDFSTLENEVLEDENNNIDLIRLLIDENLYVYKDDADFYKKVKDRLETLDSELARKLNIKDKSYFYTIFNEQDKTFKTLVTSLKNTKLNKVITSITKKTPLIAKNKDKNGNATSIGFPLFFTRKRDILEEVEEGEESEERKPKVLRSEYDVYILSNFVPDETRTGSEEDENDDLYTDAELNNKFDYVGSKGRYIKVTDINTSIFNYLYTPQEYKNLMLRLLETQSKIVEEQLESEKGKIIQKGAIQSAAIEYIKTQVFEASNDNFYYSLTQQETPPDRGGALSKVVRDARSKYSNSDTLLFNIEEERILSEKIFGNSYYKLINDPILSSSILTQRDKADLKNDFIFKNFSDNKIVNGLKLKTNETALIKIDNVIYKVTNKGKISAAELTKDLFLDENADVTKELKEVTRFQKTKEMDNWLGFDGKTYRPFEGEKKQIYQIERYREVDSESRLDNERKINYGINKVITVFSDNKSTLKIPNAETVDYVDTDAYITKFFKLYDDNQPTITVVFNNGSTYTNDVINYIINGNVTIKANPVTNKEKGLFVIDIEKLNDPEDNQMAELTEFIIENNIPTTANSIMFIKGQNDKNNYNDKIVQAVTNSGADIDLSKNLSDSIENYPIISDIVKQLTLLGFNVRLSDILQNGVINVLPSSLRESTEGLKLYEYILNKRLSIEEEINKYKQSTTVLSNRFLDELQRGLSTIVISKQLPHNMGHNKNKLSSKMRSKLVKKGILTTYDAIVSGDRTQTSRRKNQIVDINIGDIVKITAKGRADLFVEITDISNKTVIEKIFEDFRKLGIPDVLESITKDNLKKSKYAKQWSEKQGWDLSHIEYNKLDLNEKYDVDFKYITDPDKFFGEKKIRPILTKFGWNLDTIFISDKNKAKNSNAFIGYTDAKSKRDKVNRYINDAKAQDIPVNNEIKIDSNTIAMVSVPIYDLMTDNVKNKILAKAEEVLRAGGELLMSNFEDANNKYNINGEGVIIRELNERFKDLVVKDMVSYSSYKLREEITEDEMNYDCKK